MTSRLKVWFCATLAVILVACGGTASDGNSRSDGLARTQGEPGPTGSGNSGPRDSAAVSEARAQCSMPAVGMRSSETEADFRALVVGQWFLCDSPSPFATTDDVGLEFTDDGHWYKLVPNDEGMIERARDGERSGPWTVVDTSLFNGPGTFQLNIESANGTIVTLPRFAAEPDMMRINNNGVYIADYVRFDADGATVDLTPPEPEEPAPIVPEEMSQEYQTAQESCSLSPSGVLIAETTEEYLTFLPGRWLLCDSPVHFGSMEQIGLEFTSDDTWYELTFDAEGEIIRSLDWERSGTFEVIEGGDENGAHQVNIAQSIGVQMAFVGFSQDPRVMHVTEDGESFADYVRIE